MASIHECIDHGGQGWNPPSFSFWDLPPWANWVWAKSGQPKAFL